jgi:hypothetical protein
MTRKPWSKEFGLEREEWTRVNYELFEEGKTEMRATCGWEQGYCESQRHIQIMKET